MCGTCNDIRVSNISIAHMTGDSTIISHYDCIHAVRDIRLLPDPQAYPVGVADSKPSGSGRSLSI